MGKRNGDLRSLVDELVDARVERDGFLAWEYYFDFGGGSPPWISGMAQGTAMQALARARSGSTTPRCWRSRARARRVRAQHARRRPRPAGSGAWYALYSFAPRLNVLNGCCRR